MSIRPTCPRSSVSSANADPTQTTQQGEELTWHASKRGVTARNRHKKVLEQARGYYGNKSRSFRSANEQVMRSGQYAFRDRRARKGEFRRLWIQRINAGCREHDLSYSRFIAGLTSAGVAVDRRILADLAVSDPVAFGRLVEDGQGGPLNHQPELGFTNPKVQRLRRLIGRRSSRLEENAFVVEGAVLTAEAMRAAWQVESQFVAPGGQPVDVPSSLYTLAPGVAERVSDLESPPGLFAVVIRRPADPVVLSTAELVVVADRVGEPGNLGTIVRSAEAAGADAVVVTPGTVDETNPKVVRASAGALFHVPVVATTLGDVAAAGLRLIGSSSHRGTPHTSAEWGGRIAIVAGNEASGLRRCGDRRVGAHRAPWASGEPQRGDGDDRAVLRGAPPALRRRAAPRTVNEPGGREPSPLGLDARVVRARSPDWSRSSSPLLVRRSRTGRRPVTPPTSRCARPTCSPPTIRCSARGRRDPPSSEFR